MIVEGASSTLVEKGKPKDTYAPWKVIDGNPGTAWVEGAKDEGIDEFLIFGMGFLSDCYIEILPGFARNAALFTANNRPKDLEIYVVLKDHLHEIKKISDINNVIKLKEYKIHLSDEMKWQRFDLPDLEKELAKQRGITYDMIKMVLVIKSVYRGSKDNDTCISEIRFIRKKDGEDTIKEYRKRYMR
jgi:hypothetical protein